jgi:hypothetical protein
MKEEIQSWINSGANVFEGVMLLEKYCSDLIFVRLVKTNPAKFRSKIFARLSNLSGLNIKPKTAKKDSHRKTIAFRDEFPFLNAPNCPIELKALVTDKFSSFYQYRQLHEKLFSVASLEECAETANQLMSNYHENRMIYAELDHYKKYGRVLGNHPVFAHYRKMEGIRQLSVRELVKKEIALNHNIWRIESELKKEDKPHLENERKNRLKEKQAELAEVQRLLS